MIDLGASGSGSVAYGISPNGNTIVGTTGVYPTACEWTKSGSTWTMSILRNTLNTLSPMRTPSTTAVSRWAAATSARRCPTM